MLYTQFPHICKIALYCMLLCKVNSVKIICDQENGEQYPVDFSTIAAIKAANDKCDGSIKASLVDETVLHLSGEEIAEEIQWLLKVDNLGMCLIIENSGLTAAVVWIKSYTGICEGPKLSIVNNPHLKYFHTNTESIEAMQAVPSTFRMRGNRNLDEETIDAFRKYTEEKHIIVDLQRFGECALPKPFMSFETLDKSCSKFYGILTLERGTTEIQYDSTKVHFFDIEACIQIERTELKEVTFLSAFSRFKPIPHCPQYIRNNKNLCSKNLNYFNLYFENVTIANNSNQPCRECMGGPVSEQYLSESANCSYIYGDLVIGDLRGLPRYIDNLRTIEIIEGRLVISNNTGLESFVYLSSLKRVGLKNENGVAITVKDNADLKVLSMPKLVNITLKKGDRRVELVNNPMLAEELEEKLPDEATFEKQIVVDHTSSAMREAFMRNFGPFLGVLSAVFVVLSLSILGAFFMLRKEKRILNLPELPYNLRAKSQERLVQLCTEILTKNPLVWCIEDLSLIWKRNKTTTPGSVFGSAEQAKFTKGSMIPVARNGRLPQKPHNKSLQLRVEEMLEYDVIVMIATMHNVSGVVPGLPDVVGHLFAYEGGVMYKLLEVSQLSSTSTRFNYEVRSDKKRGVKNIQLVLYRWLDEQLPTEFCELLQIVTLTRGKKAICTSDRRKEIFSMLHFFYTSVIEAKGPQSAVDVFMLHSSLCNGAPLDRREMLYIMRILLEWAKSAKCISGKTEKTCLQWCQIYDQMASFTKKHRNIINVHPLHLTHLDGVEVLNKEVVAAKNLSISLSERPFAKTVDRFRRKTLEEIKREMVRTTRTVTEEYNEAVNGDVEKSMGGINALKFFAREQKFRVSCLVAK